MRTWKTLLIAAPIAAGLLAAPAAHADWRGDRGGWHGDHGGGGPGWGGRGGPGWGGERRDHDDGGAVAGAVIGLGLGALLGGAIIAQQQPYYAPPPPVVYAPPPVVYAPPPQAYYPQQGYYPAPTYSYGY